MLVVFEGIDGSGKTTISNLVAEQLRALGLRVVHVRSGGRLASQAAENIRQVARDQRNLALSPFTEFLLYVARETQQLDECIRPALRDADVVIADRFLLTAEVLATAGRGLEERRIAPVLQAASDIAVDLHVLIDVDPHVARARRRADKIARPEARTSSRKGLSGAGLMRRLRDGYLYRASRDPERWMVVDNSCAELRSLVGEVTAALVAARRGERLPRPSAPAPSIAERATDPESARDAFLAWLDREIPREPEVAAHMLGGLHGPGVDERRFTLVALTPKIVARGLRGLTDPVSWVLRDVLAQAHPETVARSLDGLPDEEEAAWTLRDRLLARAPAAVATSLEGLHSPRAWDLRQRLWPVAPTAVVMSLASDDSMAAWDLRESWLDAAGGQAALVIPPLGAPTPASLELATALCRSLRGLGSARAWTLRQLAAAVRPASALLSLTGLDDEASWWWRRRYLARAPVPVLRSITGIDSASAWSLRDSAAPACKEVLDGIAGLDVEPAWRLRHALADSWPSTTVKSLGPLGATGRGRSLVIRLLARHGDDLSLLKHAAALAVASDTPRAAAR